MLKSELNDVSLLHILDKIHPINQLYQELDLPSPIIGFIEQNQVRIHYYFKGFTHINF